MDAPDATAATATSKTILLVDDSAYWAETIGHELRRDGYAVSILNDGLAAVERIRTSPPDILITDFFLANLDGGKICQIAKRLRIEPPIMTIILTAGADRNLARVPSQYADAVIAKNSTDIVLGDLQRVLTELREKLPPPSAQREVVGHERLHPRVLSAKLHGLKQHLDALHEGIGEAVIGVDEGLRVYFLNSMALELLETAEEKALATPVTSVLNIEDEHPLLVRVREALAGTNQRRKPLTVEVKGSTVRATVAGLKSPDGKKTTLIIARDISDIKAVEAERAALDTRLHDADKMAALGRLVAGISHEINNPLAAVLPNLHHIEQQVTNLVALATYAADKPRADTAFAFNRASDDIFEVLRETTEAVQRIRSIVAELRIFNHPQAGDGELSRIEDVLASALALVANEVRFKARLERRFGTTPRIVVDRTRISQTFLNILLNATQAIDGRDPERNWIRVASEERDGGVIVEISNSGAPIPADVLPKIFDPFFTTKPQGQGMGLGLAIAYETVRRHGGYIDVVAGSGPTTFKVWLPRDTGLALKSTRRDSDAPQGHAAKLLIVDDEKLVRNSLRRVLERHHEVEVASGGEQAFELMRDREFDVVICDLIMPCMTGMELYDAIRKQRPEQAERFVFLTGGTSSSDARDFLRRVSNPRAYKPVDAKKLLVLISDYLRQFSPVNTDGST